MGQIEVVLGDIAHQDVDAVVVAASGGAPVAASASGGGAVRHVIHMVVPAWEGGGHGEARVLASSYQRALLLAEDLGVRSVAFPAATYGFPPELAAETMATAVRSIPADLDVIRLVAPDQETQDLLTAALARRIVERCPTCGAEAVPVLVGLPTPAARAAGSAGLLRLAGCLTRGPDKDPQWECERAHRWTSGDDQDARWLAAVRQAIEKA